MSGTAPPPSLEDLVPRIAPRHVFFIYAGHGAGGEEYNVDYYRAAHAPKALWKIPEAGHTGGFQARPRRVRAARHRLLRPSAARKGVTVFGKDRELEAAAAVCAQRPGSGLIRCATVQT